MSDKELRVQGWLSVIAIFLVGCMLSNAIKEASVHLITECEAELPRNQTCKLIAVVDEGD